MLSERDMENEIALNPEMYLGESGLVLVSRQYSIGQYRFDLLFEDRHGAKLIVEIQKGTLDRNHTYKILDYYHEYKFNNPDEYVDVLVVANVIPSERRQRLDDLGIAFKEISAAQFIKHDGLANHKESQGGEAVYCEEGGLTSPINESINKEDMASWAVDWQSAYDDLKAAGFVVRKTVKDEFFFILAGPKNNIDGDGFLGIIVLSKKYNVIGFLGRKESVALRELTHTNLGNGDWAVNESVAQPRNRAIDIRLTEDSFGLGLLFVRVASPPAFDKERVWEKRGIVFVKIPAVFFSVASEDSWKECKAYLLGLKSSG